MSLMSPMAFHGFRASLILPVNPAGHAARFWRGVIESMMRDCRGGVQLDLRAVAGTNEWTSPRYFFAAAADHCLQSDAKYLG